jgi:tetratricopeptide (TPR) repeat protein
MKPQTFVYGLSPFLIGTVAVVSIQTQAAVALSIPEINQVAKSITVQIDGPEHGSGVIVKRNGNTYTVLTAAHVVKALGRYTVIASDGNKASIDSSTIKPFAGIDLAILQFKSNQNYPVAEMGDSTQVVEGSLCYVSGFPLKTEAITESIYNFTEGKVRANTAKPLADGYALLYSNDTLPGMSGGPVLNEQGRLIGIHGRADTSNRGQASEINSNIVVKTGFNLGIPINTFLSAVAKSEPKLAFRAPNPAASPQQSTTSNFYLQAGDKFNKKDFKGALVDLDKVIAINPNDAKAYGSRGATYFQLKDYPRAIADFDKAIAINPNLAKTYFKRGFTYGVLEDYRKAIADFDKAIALDPRLAEAYYNRGKAYRNLKDDAKALLDYDKAISLNPKFAEAYMNRASIFANRKEISKALSDFNRAIAINPNIELAYALRGNLYASLKDYSRAIADYDKAILINPEFALIYKQRGLIYALSGKNQKAKEDLQISADLFQKQGNTKDYVETIRLMADIF